jgi:membrane dipeptidase
VIEPPDIIPSPAIGAGGGGRLHIRWITGGAAALLVAAAVVPGPLRAERGMRGEPGRQAAAPDDAVVKKARAIHDKVIALDTHNDISPTNFTAERNYTQRLDNQVNLPKMVEGGLDASFFIVYVGQGPLTPEGYDGAYKQAVEKFEAVHRLTEQIAPDKIGLALTSADVRRINGVGKKVALIGVENGYPLGDDEKVALARVEEFHDRGARYMSLAHNGHSQLSDSNTGEREGWKWNGLSPLGKKVVAEMNRTGIMIDVSHPSKESMMQAVALSKAPIIASHSGVRALADVSRNMDDEQLLALKKNGGVIQVVAFASYVKTDSAERKQALEALAKEFGLPPGTPLGGRGGRGGRGARAGAPGDAPAAAGTAAAATAAAGTPAQPPVAAGGGRQGGGRGPNPLAQLSDEKRAELQTRLAALDAKFPPPTRANVQDFVNHIDYAVKKIGIDHVGISSDFDGGGGVDGWNGADETFNVTLELVRRGYTEEQIGKIWSGNLLRVMDEVQKVAARLQKS